VPDDFQNAEEYLNKFDIKYPRSGATLPTGWVKLVNEMTEKIIALGWDKELHQIKEKFGGLRFYIGKASNEIYGLIQEAEHKSIEICQECGEPGTSGSIKGWMATLCEEHKKVSKK